jgi:hypothetical protein
MARCSKKNYVNVKYIENHSKKQTILRLGAMVCKLPQNQKEWKMINRVGRKRTCFSLRKEQNKIIDKADIPLRFYYSR